MGITKDEKRAVAGPFLRLLISKKKAEVVSALEIISLKESFHADCLAITQALVN